MDTYRGYEIKRGEGRRSRLWDWRVPTCEWRDTGYTHAGDLMNYLAGRDDYGKEDAEAGFGDGPGPDEKRKAKDPYRAERAEIARWFEAHIDGARSSSPGLPVTVALLRVLAEFRARFPMAGAGE